MFIMATEVLFILAPYVRVGYSNEEFFLGFGSIQKKIEDKTDQNILLDGALLWKEPQTPSQIKSSLIKKFPDDTDKVFSAVQLLIDGHFLIPAGSYDKTERYSRHLLFYALSGADPQKVQESLESKHVAVLGSGGIGNMVSATLATMGVRKITLVDGDIIECSNLSRQLMFRELDAGRVKVEALKQSIEDRASKIEVHTIFQSVGKDALEKIKRPVDLLVLSADTVGLHGEINEFCVKNRIPFITIGYIQDIAVFGPFVIPGRTGCYKCQQLKADNQGLDEIKLAKVKKINTEYQAPSVGPLNMMAASHGLLDIIKYLGGFGTIHSFNKRVGIWSHNFKIEEQNAEPNPNCSVCKHLF